MSDRSHGPQERVLLITGASSGIGAATRAPRRASGWRLVLAARSLERLQALAAELGGQDRALAVRCDVTEWDQQQAHGRRARCRRSAGSTPRSPTPASAGPRGFLNDTPEHWREMVLTNVYGAALTIRATHPGAEGLAGPSAAHLERRRAPRRCPARCTRAPSTRSPRWARPPARISNGTGVRVTLIEPGMTDTPFFEQPPARQLRGRRHRPRGHLRALPASPCGRQRDPDPADRPAAAEAGPRSGSGVGDDVGEVEARDGCSRRRSATVPDDAFARQVLARDQRRERVDRVGDRAAGPARAGPTTGSSSVASAATPSAMSRAARPRARSATTAMRGVLLAEPAAGHPLGRRHAPPTPSSDAPGGEQPPLRAWRSRAASGLVCVGHDADDAAAPAGGELHGAGGARIERVVLADARRRRRA